MARKFHDFWERISDGIAIQQLWEQFRADARASYQFYAKELESAQVEEVHGRRRFGRVVRGLFWAIMMKLSPARRVLLLIALVILFIPSVSVRNDDARPDSRDHVRIQLADFRIWSEIILFALLVLELADRVTMKRDLEIAREIQSWLMPAAPPDVPGVDIAFSTRPANTVAGDYYDAFLLPNQHLLVVVADVAGKSVPAALLTATLQASLRTLAALPGSLTELVARVNRYSCEQSLQGRRFTTAFVAELEPVTGVLTYVNAGHNWPILRRAAGGVERLETGGLPLGITAARSYQSGTVALARGDLLLIFTDGIVEAENSQSLEYGEERLLPVMQSLDNITANEALKRLITSVDAFVGSTRQHDDMTCVAMRIG